MYGIGFTGLRLKTKPGLTKTTALIAKDVKNYLCRPFW